jgi:hypothetical protein
MKITLFKGTYICMYCLKEEKLSYMKKCLVEMIRTLSKIIKIHVLFRRSYAEKIELHEDMLTGDDKDMQKKLSYMKTCLVEMIRTLFIL